LDPQNIGTVLFAFQGFTEEIVYISTVELQYLLFAWRGVLFTVNLLFMSCYVILHVTSWNTHEKLFPPRRYFFATLQPEAQDLTTSLPVKHGMKCIHNQ